jgi:hypothetical protein
VTALVQSTLALISRSIEDRSYPVAGTSEPIKPVKLALTQKQLDSDIGAELLGLCLSITEDGRLSATEIKELIAWVNDHKHEKLPAIQFLVGTLVRILEDGKITEDERHELHRAVEAIIPAKFRRGATDARRQIEATRLKKRRAELAEQKLKMKAEEKAAKAELRKRELEEERLRRPIFRADFMIAGCPYENRQKAINAYVEEGKRVFFIRDFFNRYDPYAIEVWIEENYMIGYVRKDLTPKLASLVDLGHPCYSFVTRILYTSHGPIPCVQTFVYRAEYADPEARIVKARARNGALVEPRVIEIETSSAKRTKEPEQASLENLILAPTPPPPREPGFFNWLKSLFKD